MVRIVIAGIGGRMGREISSVAQSDPRIELAGGTARAGASGLPASLPVVETLAGLDVEFDVVVDFTNTGVTLANARWCADHGIPIVSGVTGLSDGQLAELRALSTRTAIFYARNMSIGLNTLLGVLPALVSSLDGYDIEIVEAHHRHKADAPSGTALALAEVIANATNRSLQEQAVYGRHGIAPRTREEIGIHSVRGGGNAGEHTIIFSDEGEEIRLVHRAFSRRTFASGAICAAVFLHNSSPGFYTMTNLLSAGT